MILIKTFTRDIYDETTSIPVTFIRETPPDFNKGGRSSRSVQLLFVESHHVCIVKFFFFFSFF